MLIFAVFIGIIADWQFPPHFGLGTELPAGLARYSMIW
jgi:hypothetical protein